MAVVVTVAKGYDLGYVWKNQAQKEGAEKAVGGYYIDAAQAGEPPGRWWGPGAKALGFAAGQVVEREPYTAVYQQLDPVTGEKLGRARGGYLRFTDHLARLRAAEPHATAERLIELEREAAQATRQPAAYTDVTVSFSKSISVLHASVRENERRARLGGDERAEAYWAGREQWFQQILHAANRAALEYLQTWAGVTRTGYHGTRVDGQEPGRFEQAGLTVTSWLQGTSRDGDPQDHIHNQIARITKTFSDGTWRAHDTASLRVVIGALQGIAATAVECELTREFGVEWVPRPDGRGNEIKGVTQAQMDAYSTRTVQVREKERELAQSWQRRNGRAPNSRQLLFIADKATLQSRKGKDAGEIDWDSLAQQWDATIGGELAGIAPTVSSLRGADGPAPGSGPEPCAPELGPPSRQAQERALQKALVLVSDKHPAWTRHDLLKQLALVMPPETRQMGPAAALELLAGLAEEAISGRVGDVVCLEAPQWPPLPACLRREPDGRSVYTRPGTARYAIAAQLSMEEKLVAQAQKQGAPRLPREQTAQRLGADAALLEAQLRERAQDAHTHVTQSGLRLDQAAAIWHALTSPRAAEVITGPAGTGKTRVLAAAAHAWGGPVVGTATSQNATNELRAAGVEVTANTTKLLADIGRIQPGSLILVDEGSMVSITHLVALVDHAARNGCKLVLAGDQEQLAAVEGGGAMRLLAGKLGYAQLAEPVRFTAAWERDASLRLRQGDPTALDDYDQHGRIHGAPADEAMDQAVSKELRLVRLGAANAELDATRAEAEASAARKAGDHERGGRHEFWATSYRAMRDRYQAQEETFAKTMADRAEWEHATEHTRHLAIAADAELRRRHPDQKIEPLRSAEPAPAGEAEREQLTLAPDENIGQVAPGVRDLAAQRQAFTDKLGERQTLKVPSEDPDFEDLGHAFPAWNPPGKDAILQPPKPEITPSAKILELSREPEPGREAAD